MNPLNRAYAGTVKFAVSQIFRGKKPQWTQYQDARQLQSDQICFIRALTQGTKEYPMPHINVHFMSMSGLTKTKLRLAPGDSCARVLYEETEPI